MAKGLIFILILLVIKAIGHKMKKKVKEFFNTAMETNIEGTFKKE